MTPLAEDVLTLEVQFRDEFLRHCVRDLAKRVGEMEAERDNWKDTALRLDGIARGNGPIPGLLSSWEDAHKCLCDQIQAMEGGLRKAEAALTRAQADAAELQAWAAAMRLKLLQVEWDKDGRCPACWSDETKGHDPLCGLVAALGPSAGRPVLEALAECRRALEQAKWWNGAPDEDANAAFERIAETFRKDTGFLRPGKSQPLEMSRSDEDRKAAWNVWIAGKQEAVCESVVAALAKLDALGVP